MQTVSKKIAKLIRKTDKHRFNIKFLEAMGRLEEGCCLPGQVIIEETRLPVMGIHIPKRGFKYFGIKHGPFDLEYNWRYLTSQDNDELIQLNLYLKDYRILVCNLAPEFSCVRLFLKNIDKIQHFGFFFYSKTERLFQISFCGIDEIEREWIKRNITRAKKVNQNNVARVFAASMLQHEEQGKDAKFYLCADEPGDICYGNLSESSVQFSRINEYL